MTGSLTITAIGWIGSALVIASLTQSNLRRLRQLNLIASILHGAFNIALGIGPAIALNIVLTIINGYHLLPEHIRDRRRPPSAATTCRQLPAMAGSIR